MADGFGGGIFNEGLLTIANSTISGNVTHSFGGGLMNEPGGAVSLINSTVSGNSGSPAGAIFNDSEGEIFLTNCTITNNFSPIVNGAPTIAGNGPGRLSLTQKPMPAFASRRAQFQLHSGDLQVTRQPRTGCLHGEHQAARRVQ